MQQRRPGEASIGDDDYLQRPASSGRCSLVLQRGVVYSDAALDLDALREFLAQHLARFELPRYLVRSAEPLARTPPGKILNREIRTTALAQIGAALAPG